MLRKVQRNEMRISKEAVALLQKTVEEFAARMFLKAQWFADHANRKTVRVEDVEIARTLSGGKF